MNFIKRAFPLRRLMSIKRFLKSVLPDSLFNYVVNLWRFCLRVAYRLKSLSFTGITLQEIDFSWIKYKLYLDPSNWFIDREFFTKWIFEPAIYWLILKYSNKNWVFIDIWSNIGQYASFAAPLFRVVHAFEPVPKLFEQNLKSIQANAFTSNTFLHNLAVWSKTWTVSISCNPENMWWSSVLQKYDWLAPVQASVISLDEFLKEESRPVSVIKMDIEWYEFEAFRWMKSVLNEDMPVLIFEFSPVFLLPNFWPDSAQEMLKFIVDFWYSLYEVFDDGEMLSIDSGSLKSYVDSFDNSDRRQADILAIPN